MDHWSRTGNNIGMNVVILLQYNLQGETSIYLNATAMKTFFSCFLAENEG